MPENRPLFWMLIPDYSITPPDLFGKAELREDNI